MPIATISPNQPWEQRGDENARWYQRFSDYLALGAGRSVRGVYNREKGNDHSKPVPASWTEAAHRYEWQRRAEAYDAWRRAAVFQAGNAADTERVRKIDEVIEALHARVVAMLETAPPEVFVNDRLLTQYFAALDLMAKHTGGYAPQRIEHTGKDGDAIKVESDTPAMQVVFYLPEVGELPEIDAAPSDGPVDALGSSEEQGVSDEEGAEHH